MRKIASLIIAALAVMIFALSAEARPTCKGFGIGCEGYYARLNATPRHYAYAGRQQSNALVCVTKRLTQLEWDRIVERTNAGTQPYWCGWTSTGTPSDKFYGREGTICAPRGSPDYGYQTRAGRKIVFYFQ